MPNEAVAKQHNQVLHFGKYLSAFAGNYRQRANSEIQNRLRYALGISPLVRLNSRRKNAAPS